MPAHQACFETAVTLQKDLKTGGMDLQVISSLSALPLLKQPFSQACDYYTDVKKNHSLANSLLSVVESNIVKASKLASPYLEKYQSQIERVDAYTNERVVKRLIDYCGPVVQRTPEELSTETKKRVSDAVETVRHRAVSTQQQIYAAPAETVKRGKEMIATKYQTAIDMAGGKAQQLRKDVPAMLPGQARNYIDNVWTRYNVQEKSDYMIKMARSGYDRMLTLVLNLSDRFPRNISTNVVTPVRTSFQPYWDQTTKNFEATTNRIIESYNWMKASRLAAISTAREVIDHSVGAVWEYASDLSKEISETYSKGSSSDFLQLASRRLRTGRDVAKQLSRWTYGELVALQDASSSVLDTIFSSWVFHWLTFQPVIDRLPGMSGHEMEQPVPVVPESQTRRAEERGSPFVLPVAGEPQPRGVSAETAQKLHESMNEDDSEAEDDEEYADEEDESDVD